MAMGQHTFHGCRFQLLQLCQMWISCLSKLIALPPPQPPSPNPGMQLLICTVLTPPLPAQSQEAVYR